MYVTLVTHENRSDFEADLKLMFRQRYAIFVQQMDWTLPMADHENEIEQDQFDTEDAVYLLLKNDEDRLIGSLRFIPTVKPHLFSEIFDYMIDGDVPRSEDTWECTRFYVMTHRGVSSGLLGRGGAVLGAAMVEAALIYGVKEITTLANLNTLPMILNSGAIITPIGIPQEVGDGLYSAISIQATVLGLRNYCARRRILGSVLRIDHDERIAV